MKEACSLTLDGVDRVVPDAIFVGSRDLGAQHQINVLRRHSPKRQTFSSADRLIFAGLYQFAPTVLDALAIVKPETVIKWHRAGFRSYWLRHADCLEQRLLSGVTRKTFAQTEFFSLTHTEGQ
jgi:hypothetical protein